MPKVRARVAERLKHAASWSPSKTPPPTKPAPKPTTEQRLSTLEKTVTEQGRRNAALEKE
ncbi:hypothetical protein [Streptomyces acidicola]|uniref:hypothetical protein n=1 Tax=Streptomyces acidicola TaxID=2596892 RepID=UPI0034407B75